MRCRGSGLKPLDSSSEETEHDQDGTGGSNQCSRGRGDTCVHEETGCRDLQKFSPTLLHPVIFSSPFFLLVSASPCLSLCNHLLANLLQNTVILNVCSSTSLTIFSLSFSVSSLLVKLISIMIILNIMKWCISHQNQLFIALLSGTSHFHTSCHFRCRNSNISFFLFHSTIFSSWKGRTYHISLICSLSKPEM